MSADSKALIVFPHFSTCAFYESGEAMSGIFFDLRSAGFAERIGYTVDSSRSRIDIRRACMSADNTNVWLTQEGLVARE